MKESAAVHDGAERRSRGPEVARDAQGRSFGDFARLAEEARRHGEHAQEEAIRALQVKFLHDRYKDKYKNVLQIPREIKGFYFFEVNGENAKRGFEASKAVLGATAEFEASPETDRWKEIVDAHRSAIMGEYRINIRPRKDYVPAAIERLCDLLGAEPALAEAVSSFKVKIGPSAPDLEKPEAAFTEIVLYAKNDPEKDAKGRSGSRKALETLLPAIETALADLVPYAEKSPIKRSSAEVNELITVMQSGGDFRSLLKQVDRTRGTKYLDEYFDAKTGYAFAHGERPPAAIRRAAPRPEGGKAVFPANEAHKISEARARTVEAYGTEEDRPSPADEAPAPADMPQKEGLLRRLARLLGRGKG